MWAWRSAVTSLYPDAVKGTYCVPPVHFNRVPYDRATVPGTNLQALVPYLPSASAPPVVNASPVQQPNPLAAYSFWTEVPQDPPVTVQDSDIQDDFAINHLLLNLQRLGRNGQEPMFILSDFSYRDYLNQPVYAAAVAAAQLPQLPKPCDLRRQFHRGDFDFLSIHRHRAVLIGEVKSVGKGRVPTDDDVGKKVNKAVKQLDKSETVVTYIMNDIASGLLVRKTICLPYVSSAQLQRLLSANRKLRQAVCRSLGAADAAEATQLCLCSDQLSDPDTYWDVTPAVLSQLTAWWQRRMACTKDPLLTDQLYLDIVARFVGLASAVAVHCSSPPRVEVRTEGEAVHELGQRIARLVLTLQQLDLMNRDPPLVYLNGPPGTGKTLLLVLQGLRWLRQGHDVDVVSMDSDALASCYLIKHQLEMTLAADPAASPSPGGVRLHSYDFHNHDSDVDTALKVMSSGPERHVLLDEAIFKTGAARGPRLTRFVTDLIAQVPRLHLWVAGIEQDSPPQLQPEPLTAPLRSAPAVLREVQQGLPGWIGNVHDYSDDGVPAPGDGLSVVRLTHDGSSHTGRWPHECPQCGTDVAVELRRLGVGQAGNHVTYRDVFVLTRCSELHDETRNDVGEVTSPATGVVEGLRHAGFPVRVVGWGAKDRDRATWEDDVCDTAVARTNQLTVADYEAVFGLERQVVVMLSARDQYDDDKGRSDDVVDAGNRVYGTSRCSTHLIVVSSPYGP